MASNEVEILDPAGAVEKLKKIAAGRALNRRHFMAALGMTSAAAGAGLLSGCSATTATPATSSSGPAQTDVLAFALNLEYLEATFYSYVTQGTDLPSDTTVSSGAVTGAPGKLTFTGANAAALTDMLNEIYFDELNHVRELRTLLGILVVPRPAINLGALGAITAANALSIARLFEDVGVTAYAGAIASLNNSNLTFAAQILGVESFHAGALRLGIILQNAATAGTDAYIKADSLDVAPFDPGTAAAASAGPITASGGFFTTAAAGPGSAGTTNASTPAGYAYTRTTSQVLSIVYANTASGTTMGGFFPSGVNGLINKI
jgi:Ferritin-like domain